MQDPTHATLAELSAALESRRLSPVDLVEALLARIARRDPALHAFVAVYADEARLAAEGAARAFRSGHRIGPLHGIPIALKDLVDGREPADFERGRELDEGGGRQILHGDACYHARRQTAARSLPSRGAEP